MLITQCSLLVTKTVKQTKGQNRGREVPARKKSQELFFKLPALQDQGSVASGDTYQVHFAFLTTTITAMWFEGTRNRSGRRLLRKVELFFS